MPKRQLLSESLVFVVIVVTVNITIVSTNHVVQWQGARHKHPPMGNVQMDHHEVVLPEEHVITPAKITGPGKNPEKNVTHHWKVGDARRLLRCEAEGKPTPEIKWIKQETSQVIFPWKHNRTAGWSEIKFLKVDYGSEGFYVCVANNSLYHFVKRYYHVIVDDSPSTMTIVISTTASVVFLIVIMLLIHLRLKSSRQQEAIKRLTKQEVREFREGDCHVLSTGEDYYVGSAQVFIQAQPYNENKYEIPRRHFVLYNDKVLGTGEFGVVVEGAVQHPVTGKIIQVAVKTVRPKVDLQHFRTLLSEVKVMSYIGKHPNIVNIVGACTQNIGKNEILLAVEYCRKGNLRDFLRCCRPTFKNQIGEDGELSSMSSAISSTDEDIPEIGTRELIRWSSEVANGMDFLASKNIIHGDLAARNVLMTYNLVVKISDFGLAKQLLDYSNYVKKQQCPLPWKWMAIESLKDMHFSSRSDVWAYGILLWEIFSLGEVPYPGEHWSHEFLQQLENGKRLTQPAFATAFIYESMLECWNEDPRQRPKMFKLKEKFHNMLAASVEKEYLTLLESEYLKLELE